MSETPLANASEVRTATGEIKDASQTTSQTAEPSQDSTTTTQPKPELGEAKTDDGKTLLNKDEKKPDVAAGAPEKYEPFTLPEGFTLDEKVTTEASELFKGLNLPQDGAQKLVDFYSAKLREVSDAPQKEYLALREKWQGETKALPDIGNKLPEIKQTVSRALDGLGNPKLAADFKQVMDSTGVGDNPAFVEALYRLAKQVTEGTAVRGAGPSKFGQSAPGAAPTSAAKAMYPNLP